MAVSKTRNDLETAPGKVFAILTGAFLVTIFLLVILEQAGLPPEIASGVLVTFPIIGALAFGVTARSSHIQGFVFAGEAVSPFFGGLAIGAGLISFQIFTGFAGTLLDEPAHSQMMALGWFAGLAICTVLILPCFRKSGAVSVPDFLAMRFDNRLIRICAAAVLIIALLALLVAEMAELVALADRLLSVRADRAVIAISVLLLVCVLFGGMRSLTWILCIQFMVLAIAILLPAGWMAFNEIGIPVPQLVVTPLLSEASAISGSPADSTIAVGALNSQDIAERVAIFIGAAASIATLPHLIMLGNTSETPTSARRTGAWSMVVVALVVTAMPAYFAVLENRISNGLIGVSIAELSSTANWIFQIGSLDGSLAVSLCGQIVDTLETAIAACGSTQHVVAAEDVRIDPAATLMAMPQLAGLPGTLTGLLHAGIVAAALSGALALTGALSASASADLHIGLTDRNATENRRLLIARLCYVGVVVLAGWLTLNIPTIPTFITIGAFSLIGAAFLPVIVLGVWWLRMTAPGAVAGMVIGTIVTGQYLYSLFIGFGDNPMEPIMITWPFAIVLTPAFAAPLGILLGTIAIVAISLMTPAPSSDVRDRGKMLMRPDGITLAEELRLGKR